MNYNNFICRIAAPRPASLVSEKTPAPAAPKKSRKPARRRIAAAVAAIIVLGCAGTSAPAAEDLRVVPAPGTVVFAEGVSSAELFAETNEDTVLNLHEVFTDRVQTVAAEVVSAARPAPVHASALTVALICAGLAVACFQSARQFRTDFTC